MFLFWRKKDVEMFLFWRKKDDDETAGRKAILEHLKNLEKQNLIHWTPKEGHTIYKGRTRRSRNLAQYPRKTCQLLTQLVFCSL